MATALKASTVDFDFDRRRPPPPTRTRAQQRRRPTEVVRKEKREKFKEIITPRAIRAITHIRLIGYGADRKRYYYTEEDVKLLKQRMHEEVDEVMATFSPIKGKPELDLE